MDFNVNDWLGDWISFEHLINNHDPNLDRAWKDSTKAMRSKPLFAIMMLGDARRFWAKACKTSGKEWRFRIGGWHIEQPSAVGDDDAVAGFNLTWLDEKRTPITTHELVANGATVVVIEHDLDVIANADYVVDMGPGGGEAGGRVVCEGAPSRIAACPHWQSRPNHVR